MLGSFIKSSKKIKQFSFTPRYYDENKEKMKERYAQIEAELDGKRSLGTSGGSSLKDRWKSNKKTANFEKKSNTRLIFIITLLVGLCYWILYN